MPAPISFIGRLLSLAKAPRKKEDSFLEERRDLLDQKSKEKQKKEGERGDRDISKEREKREKEVKMRDEVERMNPEEKRGEEKRRGEGGEEENVRDVVEADEKRMKESEEMKKDILSEREQSYKIPYGGLFSYVSCPHYLAEILVYIHLVLLVPTLPIIEDPCVVSRDLQDVLSKSSSSSYSLHINIVHRTNNLTDSLLSPY
ncbi:hypothetical protein CSUI_010698, partial [Cystoisospora suis]